MGFVTRLFQGMFGGVSGGGKAGGGPTVSGVPAAPPIAPSANPPTIADPMAAAGADLSRQRAAAAASSFSSGTQAAMGAPMTASKTLLGS